MSPYELDILLWYYARCGEHPDAVRQPPIYEPTMAQFLALDLLRRQDADDDGATYAITPRGRVYVEAIQRVPLPEQRWFVEWPEEETW